MKNNYDIYFASNRLAISATPINGITSTISVDQINSAEDICRTLNTLKNVAIITDSPDEVFEKISSHFKTVIAAGGLTTNNKGEDLMIYRNGRWDLPKGHWEAGETIEECALREVEEETGVSELSIENKICTTTHIYKMRGSWEIKHTHWFSMRSSHNTPLTPQIEEGIERVAWCKKEDIIGFLPLCFPTIQKVYSSALEMQ